MGNQTVVDKESNVEHIFPLDLHQVISRAAGDLMRTIDADNCLIYLVSLDQVMLPFLVTGLVSDEKRRLFLENKLDESNDLLAAILLNNPRTFLSNQVQEDKRILPSIATFLGAEALIATTVVNHNEVIAVVISIRYQRGKPFTRQQVTLAETVGSIIALALENAQMSEDMSMRLQESQSMHQITLALLQRLDLDEVIDIICKEALRMSRASGSLIGLLEGAEWIRVEQAAGEVIENVGRHPLQDSLLGAAISRGEPILLNRISLPDQPGTEKNCSVLAIPLKVEGIVIGALGVIHQQHGFESSDVHRLQLLADQSAVAVEHARMARQVQEMAVIQERQRLSRELHDSVNQLLYAMAMYSEAALRKLKTNDLAAVERHLQNLSQSAKDALNEMRLMIYELRPPVLEEKGLQEALEQRLLSVEEKLGFRPAFKWRVSAPLPADLEEGLYGIAQEALNNVVKHSCAKNISVHLIQSGQTLLMKIEDDGNGFDMAAVGGGGMGLKTMTERANALNAHLQVQSAPGAGTSITVEVHL
ncbi:histidine kinase [Longilinea arvoryzae]|uniref:Histidine kinase n=1 Tax=Longilinea arvoryzae TaxID=360412 RepID=A0A0S7BKU9_9CHLR|nr:GAF domain-containing sensor histidine kinase [Longilinea arvoryzae]GAP14314.1 histidine kinase [Longilinea arvoryzae]